MRKALQMESGFASAHVVLAMAYALDGDVTRARAEAEVVRRSNPNFKEDFEKRRAAPAPPAYKAYVEERIVPALVKAGLLD